MQGYRTTDRPTGRGRAGGRGRAAHPGRPVGDARLAYSAVTSGDFDALFDRFHTSTVRLEARPAYTVGGAEADRIRAWKAGRPRPERTVRTSPWLARIAVSTVIGGKSWRRVRVLDDPLTEYQRYQLDSYVASQATGEQIRVARRAAVGDVDPDVWVFDSDTPDAFAAVMSYDADGRWLGFDVVDDPDEVAAHAARVSAVEQHTVPLNEFLAGRG